MNRHTTSQPLSSPWTVGKVLAGRGQRGAFNSGTAARASNLNSLDINRDGRLTLNEWPWSHRSFDQQDLDSDGAINRDEFRSGAVGTTGRQF
jgi:hypothetical protein